MLCKWRRRRRRPIVAASLQRKANPTHTHTHTQNGRLILTSAARALVCDSPAISSQRQRHHHNVAHRNRHKTVPRVLYARPHIHKTTHTHSALRERLYHYFFFGVHAELYFTISSYMYEICLCVQNSRFIHLINRNHFQFKNIPKSKNIVHDFWKKKCANKILVNITDDDDDVWVSALRRSETKSHTIEKKVQINFIVFTFGHSSFS